MQECSKAENGYYYYRDDTMLNVIGYMYGQWYVLLYIAVMLIPVPISGWGVVLNAFSICYICFPLVFAYAYNYIDALLILCPFMILFTAEVLCMEQEGD